MNSIAIDTAIYHNGRTYAEHGAWLDSLTGDDYRMVHMPIGHLFSLAMVATFKSALLTLEMTTGERLKFLEGIARYVDGPITAAAVEAIEPYCATGAAMMAEINSLPIEKQTIAFQGGDVFRLLARLNPSLLAALRLCSYNGPIPENPRTIQ